MKRLEKINNDYYNNMEEYTEMINVIDILNHLKFENVLCLTEQEKYIISSIISIVEK